MNVSNRIYVQIKLNVIVHLDALCQNSVSVHTALNIGDDGCVLTLPKKHRF